MSDKPKWTPGPWKADDTRVICSLDDCVDAWVATVCTPADASLIAEAPNLVAALEKIAYEPFGHPEASCREVLQAITDCARAALAKVKP